jgi:hypothetical protein
LLCDTIDLRLPKDKKATKEKIEKDVSELVVSCWNQFGGGKIKDPFKEGDSFINNCFICYTVSLGEASDFKRGKDEILSKELSDYMFNKEYKPKIPSFSCEKNNGKCWESNLDAENYVEKDELKCPKEEDKENKCFVKKTSINTYLSYIQNAGGVVVIDDIKPSETYAIAFGSPTENCGWCETGQEVGAILAGGAILIGGVATGGALWLVAPAALVAAGGGALIGHSSGKIAASIKEIITERKTHTIYLTTLNRLNSENGELCSIVESQ